MFVQFALKTSTRLVLREEGKPCAQPVRPTASEILPYLLLTAVPVTLASTEQMRQTLVWVVSVSEVVGSKYMYMYAIDDRKNKSDISCLKNQPETFPVQYSSGQANYCSCRTSITQLSSGQAVDLVSLNSAQAKPITAAVDLVSLNSAQAKPITAAVELVSLNSAQAKPITAAVELVSLNSAQAKPITAAVELVLLNSAQARPTAVIGILQKLSNACSTA